MGIGESDGRLMRPRTVMYYIGCGGLNGRMFIAGTGHYKDAVYKVLEPVEILKKGRDYFSLLVHFIGTPDPVRYFSPKDREANEDDILLAKQRGTDQIPRRKRSK